MCNDWKKVCVHLFFQCVHLKDSPLGNLGATTSTQCCLPIVKDHKYMVRNISRFCKTESGALGSSFVPGGFFHVVEPEKDRMGMCNP